MSEIGTHLLSVFQHYPDSRHSLYSSILDFFYFLPFLLAIVAEQAGQYHLPFGGAVMPTHG